MTSRKRKRASTPGATSIVVSINGKKKRTTAARFCADHADDERLCAAVRALRPGAELEAERGGETMTVGRSIAGCPKRGRKRVAHAVRRPRADRRRRRRSKPPHKPLALLRSRLHRLEQLVGEREARGEE